MATKLSSKDAAAVKKAGVAGGLSSSQSQAVVTKTNTQAPSSSQKVVAPTKSAGLDTTSYGIDKKTGKPVGPGNDPRTGAAARLNTPAGINDVGEEVEAPVPGGAETPPAVPQAGLQQGTVSTITDPVTGQTFSRDTSIAGSTYAPNKYKTALKAAQDSGLEAPSEGGMAKMGMQGFVPPTADTSAVDSYISQDPAINTLMAGITQLLNPQQQTSTLMQDYKKLYKESGLDDINEEIIDAETVINGTEDDIRNEIQTAGGFGTDSQVQALALSRNKSLLTRYNQLVQMKTDATNQLNTLSSLNAQDKQIAQQRINTQIGAMFNMANFRQQAINNVQEQTRWLAQTMGADGLYSAYKNDPRQLAFLEKTLGLAQGGLAPIAANAAKARAQDVAYKQAQINNLNKADTAVVDVGGRKYLINSQTGATIREIAPGANATGTLQLAKQQSAINQTNGILSSGGLQGAVGPNALSRNSTGFWSGVSKFLGGAAVGGAVGAAAGAPFAGIGAIPGAIGGSLIGGFANLVGGNKASLTGEKQNFIGDVEQLRSGLTLDTLTQAKANGATFGALSDGEHRLLNSASTKIGSWAIKDGNGNVVGYNASEADFKNEINKINNFAKLDYVLKGGNPQEVGIQQMEDGTLWVANPDGTYTEIR